LHVADTQPRDRERRLPLGERAHEPEEPLLLRQARVHDPSELAIEGVVDEAAELLEGALDVAPGTARPKLEVTHADKGGRCAARDRAPLSHQVVWRVVVTTLVVVAVPHALRVLGARGDEAEGACRGHSHGMHRLRDEELTDRGAQHRTPVTAARERCPAAALELQLPLGTGARVHKLTERERAPVAVGVAPAKWIGRRNGVAEDGHGVRRCPRAEPRARRQLPHVARKHLGKHRVRRAGGRIEVELGGHRGGNRNEVGIGQRHRVDLHPLAKDLARLLVGLLRLRLRVGAKRALEAVVQGAHDRDERQRCHRRRRLHDSPRA